ncbi:DNA mismatch repair protein [Elasticomyces elasticus]|nr:DNA mismatch repair protein [Elasticomyces elasticus]
MQNGNEAGSADPSVIRPLPAEVVAQLGSSATITNLNQVVIGLLQNALDAQSSKVEITLDYRRGGCVVEENGLGIPPHEFSENGGLGRMYCTSKRYVSGQEELHGSLGIFLASLSALSLLTITSRHFQHRSHNTVTLHRSNTVARQTPAPAQHEISSAHGTRVTVRDLFGDMPVRVKQRALVRDERTEDEKQWQSLRKDVVALLLAWSMPVSVKLRSADGDVKPCVLSAHMPSAPHILTEKSINMLNRKSSSFSLENTLSILSQGGFISASSRHSWVPVSASTLKMSIKGAISLDPAPTKQSQFISIGIHQCSSQKEHSELYDCINRVFGFSSFGSTEEESEPDETEIKRRKRDRRYKADGYTDKQMRGRRKGVDRWPVFVLRITLKDTAGLHASIENSRRSDAMLTSIVEVLEAMVNQWLGVHHCRPRKRRRRNIEVGTKRSKIDSPLSLPSDRLLSQKGCTTEPSLKYPSLQMSKLERTSTANTSEAPNGINSFCEWSRIKSGRKSFYDSIWDCNDIKPPTVSTRMDTKKTSMTQAIRTRFTADLRDTQLSELASGRSPSTPGGASVTLKTCEIREQVGGACRPATRLSIPAVPEDEVIEWQNPMTKETCRVNARTGVVMPSMPCRTVSAPATSERLSAAVNTSLSAFGRPISISKRRAVRPVTSPRVAGDVDDNSWLNGFLGEWNNPVFSHQKEHAIPVASFRGLGLESPEHGHRCDDRHITETLGQKGSRSMQRLSKAALKQAKVIAQVDKKFILVKMPKDLSLSCGDQSEAGETLVLVDQHAASERCILESLLDELCSPLPAACVRLPGLRTYTGRTPAVSMYMLDKPLSYIVCETDHLLFKKHAARLANWGILYDLESTSTTRPNPIRSNSGESEGRRLIVKTLPSVIVERCKTDPKLLIELLRTEIHNPTWDHVPHTSKESINQEEGRPDSQPEPHAWLRKIQSCPRGILDLINSRACRSAVMFNDELTRRQCEDLLSKLADCAFPFICAHGRVSMVPVVETGGAGVGLGDVVGCAPDAGRGFAEAYRVWMGSGSRDGGVGGVGVGSVVE